MHIADNKCAEFRGSKVGTALHTVVAGGTLTGVVVAGDALQEERAGEEHHRKHVRHAQGLPLIQQLADEVSKELLEIQVSVLHRMKFCVKYEQRREVWVCAPT